MNGEFMAWDAAPREDCPLQACPAQVEVLSLSAVLDPANQDCCIFEWTVTNNGTEPLTEFYLDIEAGSGGTQCRDINLPGWTATYCYPWDFAVPSNWGVVHFTDGELPPKTSNPPGEIVIEVHGLDPVPVALPNWHPFLVRAKGIHVHVTDYSPLCLGVDCAAGQFGPHIANDIHDRDQRCFWSDSVDFVCCPWDLDGSRRVGVSDLLILLAIWGPCPGHIGPGCLADFNVNGDVGIADLLDLLANWGQCP